MNLTDYRGLTPLKISRRYGQEEIEEMLQEKGAQLEVKVRQYQTEIVGTCVLKFAGYLQGSKGKSGMLIFLCAYR